LHLQSIVLGGKVFPPLGANSRGRRRVAFSVPGVKSNGLPIDNDALAAWGAFLRFHATVTDVLGRELSRQVGMPLTWFDVLFQLDAAPGHQLRMQDLANAVVLSKSGLTRLVDRLEQAGYVERRSCPSDRRGTFAEITAKGRAALGRAKPVHLQGVAHHFAAHLTDAEVSAFGSALDTLLAAHQGAGDLVAETSAR
jgi:DNA-binding MarR family transcriptional regulator